MPAVVLHGPSFSPANPQVTPEAIAGAVNVGLLDKADAAQTAADASTADATIATAQQRLDTLNAGVASANATIAALQSTLTATQNRVTALETAHPPPAVPNAVASFTLGATTNTTQVLNWTAPSGGAALTFYDTKYKIAGSATWSAGPSVAIGTLTATVTGLTAGTNYDYSVVTRNAAGPGASSATLTKPTTTTFTPSAAWTKIPPATSITMNDGRVVTVVSGVIYITPQGGSTVPMGNTNSVILVEISDTGVVYQENSFNDWWYWNAQNEWIATFDPQAGGGPGPGPAYQDLTGSYNDMGHGQRCSTGVTSFASNNFVTGVYTMQIKPYQWNGIWRGSDTGNYLAPMGAAFIDRGRYLDIPDTPRLRSATGCPALNPVNNHITGFPAFISWWTAGNITAPIEWGLFFEPGFDSGDGQVYAVIEDYKASRGDTFHVTANMAGRGVFRSTSWGSILDYTAEASGTPGYGLGWIAFVGHTITPNQIIANW